MIFLFPRWDMLVPWRVTINDISQCWTQYYSVVRTEPTFHCWMEIRLECFSVWLDLFPKHETHFWMEHRFGGCTIQFFNSTGLCLSCSSCYLDYNLVIFRMQTWIPGSRRIHSLYKLLLSSLDKAPLRFWPAIYFIYFIPKISLRCFVPVVMTFFCEKKWEFLDDSQDNCALQVLTEWWMTPQHLETELGR